MGRQVRTGSDAHDMNLCVAERSNAIQCCSNAASYCHAEAGVVCAPKDLNSLTLNILSAPGALSANNSHFSQLNRFKLFPLITSDGKVHCGCNLEEL
jgi:hypothetical protein